MQSKPLSFNDDAKLYDRMRPGYPKEVFTKLRTFTGLNRESRILEVGCGSGQATNNLTKIAKHITCIDPGENLLEIAQAKFPEISFVKSTFEDYETEEKYNLIISATAWHWVNPAVGYHKANHILENHGYLAILRNYHIEQDPEAFHNKADFIYQLYSKPVATGGDRQAIEDQRLALDNQYFKCVQTLECPWEQTYTIDEYIALRNTYSDHRTMRKSERLKFEQELRDFAHKYFNDKITKHYVALLLLAQKKS